MLQVSLDPGAARKGKEGVGGQWNLGKSLRQGTCVAEGRSWKAMGTRQASFVCSYFLLENRREVLPETREGRELDLPSLLRLRALRKAPSSSQAVLAYLFKVPQRLC